MPICEGCGTRSDELHVQRRVERLRLAKIYRPTSVRVLLLDAAPPSRMEDFFYSPSTDRSPRSPASRSFFDAMIKLLGSAPGADKSDEAALAEFARRGFFLVHAVECPFDDLIDPQSTLRRLAPTIIKRVQTELEPSYVVPISKPTQELIRLFGMVGWGDRLVLDNGGPFLDPSYGDRLRKSIAQLP